MQIMSGMIGDTTRLIESDTGLIPETNNVEDTANKRREHSRERGKDSKPRNYHYTPRRIYISLETNLVRKLDRTYLKRR